MTIPFVFFADSAARFNGQAGVRDVVAKYCVTHCSRVYPPLLAADACRVPSSSICFFVLIATC